MARQELARITNPNLRPGPDPATVASLRQSIERFEASIAALAIQRRQLYGTHDGYEANAIMGDIPVQKCIEEPEQDPVSAPGADYDWETPPPLDEKVAAMQDEGGDSLQLRLGQQAATRLLEKGGDGAGGYFDSNVPGLPGKGGTAGGAGGGSEDGQQVRPVIDFKTKRVTRQRSFRD